LLPFNLSTPTAMKPPTPLARAFAAWKIPMRNARSLGLYQKLKYIRQAGTYEQAVSQWP